jgi:hypothetical protein
MCNFISLLSFYYSPEAGAFSWRKNHELVQPCTAQSCAATATNTGAEAIIS